MSILLKVLGGIGLIVFGCYVINYIYKNSNKISWSSIFKGYVAGFGFIFIGILYILQNLQIINW